MDDCNRICVLTNADEVSRAFKKLKRKEAETPQKQCDSAKAKEKISPAHIVSTTTRCRSFCAGEVSNEWPSNLRFRVSSVPS